MCGEWLLVQRIWGTGRSHCLEHNIAFVCPPGTAISSALHRVPLTCATRLLPVACDGQTEAAGSALAGSPQPGGLPAAPRLLWRVKLAVQVLSRVWLYPSPVATF